MARNHRLQANTLQGDGMGSTGADQGGGRCVATPFNRRHEVGRRVALDQHGGPCNRIDSLTRGGRREIVIAVRNEMKPDMRLLMEPLTARPEMMGKLDEP